jgi:hypothetical protein
MIRGRYDKKKTKIKNNLRSILKNRVHITVIIPFFEMPYRLVGRKVCFVRSSWITLENWVQVFMQ